MTPELKSVLDLVFNQHPILMAGPVHPSEVPSLERYAGFQLPQDYKTFVVEYGGAIVGPYPIYGLRRAEPMGMKDESARAVTERYKAQMAPGIEKWLIISMDLSGSPIGIVPSGEIWISDVEWGIVERMSPTFSSFLWDICLKNWRSNVTLPRKVL